MAFEYLGPTFHLFVSGKDLGRTDISKFVEKVEYESSDNMIDVAKLTVANPNFLLSAAKVFMPGNELDVWMGYKKSEWNVGRVVLQSPKMTFPLDGMPVLEVTGYTKDYQLREVRPRTGKTVQQKQGEPKKPGKVVWVDTTVDEVVTEKAQENLMYPDVDPVSVVPSGGIIHEARSSDFDLIQGLANITGFVFWVDYDVRWGWTLHFKDPASLPVLQDQAFEFKYNQGDNTTLLHFEPEMLFQGHYTQIRVQGRIRHPLLGIIGWEDFLLAEEKDLEPDPAFLGVFEDIEGPLPSAEAVRVFIGDYSFAVMPQVEITSRAALENYVVQWYRRMQEDFIVGTGSTIGEPRLMARQEHVFSGLGAPYDGKYYFSRVHHIQSASDGYKCEFTVRKVLGS